MRTILHLKGTCRHSGTARDDAINQGVSQIMTIQVSNEPDDFFSFEHDGWEAVCAGYEQYFLALTRQSVTPLLDAARVTAGSNLLDVSTGPGLIAAAAAARGACAAGLDFSAESLGIARRNYPAIEFYQGDVQALPFDDDLFDAVICGYGIIYVPDPAKALAEMKRILKPGACQTLSARRPPAPDNGYGLVFDAINTHAEPVATLPHGPDFFSIQCRWRTCRSPRAQWAHGNSCRSVEPDLGSGCSGHLCQLHAGRHGAHTRSATGAVRFRAPAGVNGDRRRHRTLPNPSGRLSSSNARPDRIGCQINHYR